MAYSVGSVITAADFNTFLGRVNTIYSTGSGSSGYGQPTLLSSITAGTTITGAQWQALRTMIQRCAAHQGISQSNLPPVAAISTGATVVAHSSGTTYDLAGLITSIENNRLVTFGTDRVLTSAAYTLTRSAAWSGATACSITATFANESDARLFFNTGGEIRVRLLATGTLASSSASQDVDWRSVINKVGTLRITADQFISSASVGGVEAGGRGGYGFYSLTENSFSGGWAGRNIGSGAYAANDVIITARVANVAGSKGGNGNTVVINILLNDEHSNSFYDSVSGGLQAVIDLVKVDTTNLPTAIAAPVFGTDQNWS